MSDGLFPEPVPDGYPKELLTAAEVTDGLRHVSLGYEDEVTVVVFLGHPPADCVARVVAELETRCGYWPDELEDATPRYTTACVFHTCPYHPGDYDHECGSCRDAEPADPMQWSLYWDHTRHRCTEPFRVALVGDVDHHNTESARFGNELYIGTLIAESYIPWIW